MPPPGRPRSQYAELPAPAAHADVIACSWMQHIDGPDGYVQRVLPDGCVDILWEQHAGLTVVGPATRTDLPRMPGDSTTLGIRFRPGAGPAALGVPAAELVDVGVDLEALWRADTHPLEDRLAAVRDPRVQLRLLTESVTARIGAEEPPDGVVAAAVGLLDQPGTRVADLGVDLGISERQLRRRFHDAVGYGPKTLDRVLRLWRFLTLAESSDDRLPLAIAAAQAGYADQAHLDHDCARLSGLTPTALLAARAAAA